MTLYMPANLILKDKGEFIIFGRKKKNKSAKQPLYTLEFKDGNAKLEFDTKIERSSVIRDSMEGKSHFVLNAPVQFIARKDVPAGVYQVYLLHQKGVTVSYEIAEELQALESEAEKIEYLGTQYQPVKIQDSSALATLKTGNPELTNRIEAANLFAKAVSLESTRRGIVMALVAGILIGSIFLAPIMGAIISLIYAG